MREQIDRKGYLHHLGGGVVLTGGASLVGGAADLAAEIFGLPARIGYPVRLGGLVEEYASPMYATGVGLVLHGASREASEPFELEAGEGGFTSTWERMRRWFKDFF